MQNKTGFWNVSQKVWGCEDGVKRISLFGFSSQRRLKLASSPENIFLPENSDSENRCDRCDRDR